MRHGRAWTGEFRGAGYRVTEPRVAILRVLESTDEHLSAKDIFHRMQNILPGIGLATIYRNLEVLENLGLLSRFDMNDGLVRYSLRKNGNEVHSHLICTNCGAFMDYIEGDSSIENELDTIYRTIKDKYGFSGRDFRLNIYGQCSKCEEHTDNPNKRR